MRHNPKYGVPAGLRVGSGNGGYLLDDLLSEQIFVYLCRPKGDEFAETVESVRSQDEFPRSCVSSMRGNTTKYTERQSNDGQAFHDMIKLKQSVLDGWQISGQEAAETVNIGK